MELKAKKEDLRQRDIRQNSDRTNSFLMACISSFQITLDKLWLTSYIPLTVTEIRGRA